MKKFIFIVSMAFALTMVSGNYALAQEKTTKVKTSKGWSHRAKDAAIGAGVGAVTGAVVSKKHGKGAVIGGAVGAGAGYIYGRHKDRKYPNHRTQKTVYKTK